MKHNKSYNLEKSINTNYQINSLNIEISTTNVPGIYYHYAPSKTWRV